jgi:hypothetical protein
MWYRKSNDFMSGIIPEIKGADNAPLIDDEVVAENDNPYKGHTLEEALEDFRSSEQEHQSILNGTDTTPTVYKGNISALVAKSYDTGPGMLPSNKKPDTYSF